MGYRAIKTSESGDKFLSTLFKFRTKPRSQVFVLRRNFVRLGFRFWETSRRRLKLSPRFLWHVDIIWDYLGRFLWRALTLFDGILTLSTRSPLNQPLSYSLTKTCGISNGNKNTKQLFTNDHIPWNKIVFVFWSLYVFLYLYFVFVEGLVCVWFARGQVTGVLSRGRVAGAGVDKWPYFVGERSPPSSGRPWSHTALLALQGTARMHTHTWWHIPRAHNVLMCYQHLVVLLGCTLHTWYSTYEKRDCMFDTTRHKCELLHDQQHHRAQTSKLLLRPEYFPRVKCSQI